MTAPRRSRSNPRELAAVTGQAAFITLVILGCLFDETRPALFWTLVALACCVLLGSGIMLLVDLVRRR